MLAVVKYRRREEQQELDEIKFEQDMFINNPSLYEAYMKQKQEDESSGNEGVTWIAPESVEEANALLDVFADIDQKIDKREQAADQQFIKQLELMNTFDGININELGDE